MVNQDHIVKHLSELKKAQKMAQTYESDLTKMKDALAAKIKKREASDNLAVKSLVEVDAANEKMNVALQ